MSEFENRTVFKNVFTDISRPTCITLLHCRDHGQDVIIYGLSDCELGHYGLYELAMYGDIDEENVLSDDAQIIGGALLDFRTLEKIRDSHAFGEIEEPIINRFIEKMEKIRARKRH